MPLIALLVARLADRTVALVATALVAPSWMLLFHGVYGRMYSMFLFTATLSYLALLSALARRDRRGWILWALAILACIATHPYGALVLGSQGLYVLYSRRLRNALPAFVAVARARDSVLAQRHACSPPASTSASAAAASKLGGPVVDPPVPRARRPGTSPSGWTIVRTLVLLLALAGLVLLARWRRASAALVALHAS